MAKNLNFFLKLSLILILLIFVFVTIFIINNQNKKSRNFISNVERKIIIQKRFKILHVMSYHIPLEWSEDQFSGFKDALKDLSVEYKIFQMDTLHKSSLKWKEKAGKEARNIIDTWKPDLVYTSDDDAQEYVAKYYVNKNIPIVFSGVNAKPETYGFAGSKNITGILEQEHITQTIKLLKELKPDIVKIAVIADDNPIWIDVIGRMKELSKTELKDVEFLDWDYIKTFNEYKNKIKEYQKTMDAVALLGVHTFKDEKGNNVNWKEVLEWTAKNSKLPDFSFWKGHIAYGTLCSVYISGYEQGYETGKIAYQILADGKSPSSFKVQPAFKGKTIISLARAKRLSINIKSSILLNAEIVSKFKWEK